MIRFMDQAYSRLDVSGAPTRWLSLALVLLCLASYADVYRGFRDPKPVTIRGYSGQAMEPFLTRDGRYLLFNNSNDPATDTDLQYAERVDDGTFDYRGKIRGANSAALDAVPSMDREGNLYFVSTRS
jgi:hypothetical protein